MITQKALQFLVKLYQVFLAKFLFTLFSVNPSSSCRHLPSCSEYAFGAIEKFGAVKGTYLAAKRIINCRPGGSFGFDPLP